jgi:hypothetical protein
VGRGFATANRLDPPVLVRCCLSATRWPLVGELPRHFKLAFLSEGDGGKQVSELLHPLMHITFTSLGVELMSKYGNTRASSANAYNLLKKS